MVIVILGIIASIASIKIFTTIELAKFDATKSEMQALRYAIVGNPNIIVDGARTDFGYVGDIGALPPDLNALLVNPGYGTWDGPYIGGNFSATDLTQDAWKTPYQYTGTVLRSTGSGETLETQVVPSIGQLLANSISGICFDANRNQPGSTHHDSLSIVLEYPDGAGNMAIVASYPDKDGYFSFPNIPVGNHTLRVIYIPASDTLTVPVCVTPGSAIKLDITFPSDLW